MGDTAGQLADGLHLLRLMQHRLGLTSFSDFGSDAVLEGLVELLQGFEGAYPVDRRAQEVGDGLEEINVVLAEGRARSPAIGFEHAERLAVPHEDDIDGPRDGMLRQQLRRAKTIIVRKVIRNHRLTRVHGVARR